LVEVVVEAEAVEHQQEHRALEAEEEVQVKWSR
jgi:hypothetical protein